MQKVKPIKRNPRQQQKEQAMGRNQIALYGRHVILAAIANEKRRINKIMCLRENFEDVRRAMIANDRNQSLIQVAEKVEIDLLLPKDAVHQGFLAYVQPLENYTIEEIIEMADEKKKCHVLILDQVTDPQNIGAIIRSCAAFDALALVIQDKNSPTENGAMAKASAGTIEILPICRVTNLSRAIELLKKANFWAVGMDGEARDTIDKISKSGKTAIVMGSEGKGMRRLVEENCDLTIKLPISERVESLNVSTAAAIALYELNK